MPLMSKKKQPFIIDESLSAALKPYLPADSRTTVECGLPNGTKDYPWIINLCQRKKAMLVTAEISVSVSMSHVISANATTAAGAYCCCPTMRESRSSFSKS